jgi:hypothetical protein
VSLWQEGSRYGRKKVDDMARSIFAAALAPTPAPSSANAGAGQVSAAPARAPVLPIATAGPVVPAPATAASGSSSVVAPKSQDMFLQLALWIEWRSEGHLTDSEFAAAKRLLGLS